MSTNKVIRAVLIVITVLLISIFIYQKVIKKTCYEFIVQADNCENTPYLIILNTYLDTIDVENHDPLVIPTNIFEPNFQIEASKFYKVTGTEKQSGEITFSIDLTDKTSHKKLYTPAIYKKFSAEREHTFCGLDHYKNYHTKRHIVKVGLSAYVGSPNDTLTLASSSTNAEKYYLYKVKRTNTDYVVLDEALDAIYPGFETSNLYFSKDYDTKFFIEVEGEIIGVYKIEDISDTHEH
jgi:hypothetical protein